MRTEPRGQRSRGAQRGSHSVGELGRLNETLVPEIFARGFDLSDFQRGRGIRTPLDSRQERTT